jgi:hypothetical protein
VTKKLRAIALLAILATPAQAQQDIDTLYRAAYCVGVLKALVEQQPGKSEQREHLRARLQPRRERYENYVRAQAKPGDATIAATIARGEDDAVADRKRSAGSQLTFTQDEMRCSAQAARRAGDAQGKFSLERFTTETHACLTEKDQALADRYACRSMPDRLPF